MPAGDFDERLRVAMFAYLDRISNLGIQDVSTDQLNAFEFEGNRISLLQHMRGIRVVSGLPAALSIRTTFATRPGDRPYEDAEGPDGYFRYKWRGTDSDAHDNVALRVAMSERRPMAWFVGVASGRFAPIYPVWLVGEEADQHQFIVAFDEVMRDDWSTTERLQHPADLALRREYAEATVRRRFISQFSANGSSSPITPNAPSAGSAIRNFSTQHTSERMRTGASQSFPMESQCALSTTGPSTATSSEFDRTT